MTQLYKLGDPVRARKIHIFDNGTSLCGSWMYMGGTEYDFDQPKSLPVPNSDICKSCARKAGLIE
jgi:hypothetical protein